MNPDGSINEEVARAKIPESIPKDKANEVINKCKVLSEYRNKLINLLI